VSKSRLIDAVSTTTLTTKSDAAQAVDAVVGAVTDEVRTSPRISVVVFNSFNPTQRGVRVGRHPQALKKCANTSTNMAVRLMPAAAASGTLSTRSLGASRPHRPSTCSGEENSEAIGQQGRTACSGHQAGQARPGEENS
jgi:nucleoid DNA-binding protein